MKKFLCSVLVLIITLSLCGCGNLFKLVNDIYELQETLEEQQKEEKVGRGRWDGDRYINDFAELTFTLDDGWRVKSDEDIAEMVGMTLDMIYDENGEILGEYIEKSSVYDTMVTQDKTVGDNFSDNMIVVYEFAGFLGSGSDVEKTYAQKVIKGLESNYNQNLTFSEIVAVEIGGNTYYSFVCVGQVGDVGYAQQYAIRKEGKYMVSVIATGNDYHAVCDIYDNFDGYRENGMADAVAGMDLIVEDITSQTDADQVYGETGWNDNVYTNIECDVVFVMPADWSGKETLDPSAGFEVQNANGSCNVQLLVENVGVSNIPDQLYMDSIIESLDESYEEIGASYELGETETITIGGNEYIAVNIDVKHSYIDMVQCIAVRTVENNLVSIIITDVSGEVENVFNFFQ